MRSPRQALGAAGEAAAAEALRVAGYAILEHNVRTPFGEIDLIARQGGALCFIEVKTRAGEAFGHPFEAVTPAKRSTMRRCAAFLLQARKWDDACRFDVVAVLPGADGKPRVEILADAFQ